MSNLIFSNVDVVELARKYGTPLYVVSEDIIADKCIDIRNNFLEKYNNTKAYYAGKAFLTLAMCKIIQREGLGLDVVSGGELFVAIKANFPMENVLFHGNNKSIEELELAINHNVGRIVVDNIDEIQLIEQICRENNKTTNVLYRITPGVNAKTHRYISTAQVDSKFGIPLNNDVLFEAVRLGLDSKHINFMGFHFHIGSQLLENTTHLKAIEVISKVCQEIKDEFGYSIKELNTGGGYGIKYTTEQTRNVSFFTDSIVDKVYEEFKSKNLEIPTILIEPGRWIIGEAGITLYSIGNIKRIPDINKTYVSIDGGMTDNIRPGLYGSQYNAVIANKIGYENEETVSISGKCCESTDILIQNMEVPKLNRGDILAVFSTGAYNYSMASNYNKSPFPAVVLIKDGFYSLIVKRDSFDDLIRRDFIPSYLY